MCCVQEKNICMWHIWATVVITFWRNIVILMSTNKFHEALVQERLVDIVKPKIGRSHSLRKEHHSSFQVIKFGLEN